MALHLLAGIFAFTISALLVVFNRKIVAAVCRACDASDRFNQKMTTGIFPFTRSLYESPRHISWQRLAHTFRRVYFMLWFYGVALMIAFMGITILQEAFSQRGCGNVFPCGH